MSATSETTPENPAEESVETAAKAIETQTTTAVPEEESNLREEDPIAIFAMFGVSLYVGKMWWDDFVANRKGSPNQNALPGATSCPPAAIWIAVIVGLILLGLETAGEYALGISGEQHDIMAILLFSMISAAFIEELIFRGFLVVDDKGKGALIASVIGFSFLFSLFHPHFWSLDMPDDSAFYEVWKGSVSFDFGVKAWFTHIVLFIGSLWFYTVRFFKWNPNHSIIPCMAAHLAKNIGVFVIKLFQGHVVGLY